MVGTDSDDRVWIPTTVSGTHKLAAHVATGCFLGATVETPLGTEVVLEVEGYGPCLADVGPLDYYPDGYYGMMAQQQCTSGGTSKVYLADQGIYYKIPNCNPN